MRKPLTAAASMAAVMSLAVPATAAARRQDPVDRAIADYINAIRRTHGLQPMHFDRRLHRAANAHSSAMATHNTLTHSPSLYGRLMGGHAHAARVVGETLAWMPKGTRRLAHRTVIAWMHSPPHRAALLDARFHRIGVGRRRAPNGTFVTADLSS
jgi:uncharacterized protein YkwD